MNVQFVDTYYLLALLNTKDRSHSLALQHSQGPVHHLITTAWVLVEFLDALSGVRSRAMAAQFLRGFLARPFVEVVPPTWKQVDHALDFYNQRPDKEWSLTNCISFQVMQDHGISEALTGDHHFDQAGFRALLRQ